MLRRDEYPILEFDDCEVAVINPDVFGAEHGMLPSDKLVITFFKDVISTLLEEGKLDKYTVLPGENEIVIYKFKDSDTLLMHGAIGCPACGGFLDELTGMGIKRVMFCGGGGVLDKNIGVGELLVVEGSIRDEGFSYHYVEPSRVIYTQKDVCDTICEYLDENKLPYMKGLTWTTDALYRETKDKVQLRKSEGAKIVEMEQSGCIAVSQFRGIKYGAIIYSGDDVSGEAWDKRGWKSRKSIRYELVSICREIVERL